MIAHHSMMNAQPSLLLAYPGHVYSGSLGPDWFYNLYGGFGGYSEASDAMHSYGTRSVYFAMLDAARNMVNDQQLGDNAYRCFEAARSFAYGFISHVAADCIYHPYVNRRANNPWTGDKHGASAHAGVETVIDNILWKKYGNFNIEVNCCSQSNSGLVDYPVRRAFKEGLTFAYPDQDWLLGLLRVTNDDNNNDHPINEAFRAVRQWTAITEGLQFASAYNVNDIIQHLKSMSLADIDENTALNPLCTSWCNAYGNEILTYSAEQLFEIALNAATAAITIGERYVNGEIISFDGCGVPFLERDYNIDTGLPSDKNSTIHNRATEERFAIGTDILFSNYQRFGG